jgi:glycine dehydrogenase subunit 1
MRYIPHTEEDVRRMLKVVGVGELADLFGCIPLELKLKDDLKLPEPLDEEGLCALLGALAQKNTGSADRAALFLGAGAYSHHLPRAVDQILMRSEFFTAYTPYQPEVSQGTLQAIFEYQTMMASLVGCEVVNASMYDGATAAAEALLMARRIKRKRKKTLVSRAVHPEVRAVCDTYLRESQVPSVVAFSPQGTTDPQALTEALDQEVAAVLVQQPNTLGCLENLPELARAAHAAGALLVVVVLEPISLGLLEGPGALGADIVVGEGMGLGTGLNFGGPGLGIFGASKKNAWQIPGRLVGQTQDAEGRRGFVLTMSTREQHIRRARATSNICTNEGLCALAAAVHLALLSKSGFEQLARTNAANARAAFERLTGCPGVAPAFSAPGFNEFVLKLDRDAGEVLRRLKDQGIIGGLWLERFYPELKDCLLVCVTELNTREQVEKYAAVLES